MNRGSRKFARGHPSPISDERNLASVFEALIGIFLLYSANLTIGRIFYILFYHTSDNLDNVLPLIVLFNRRINVSFSPYFSADGRSSRRREDDSCLCSRPRTWMASD